MKYHYLIFLSVFISLGCLGNENEEEVIQDLEIIENVSPELYNSIIDYGDMLIQSGNTINSSQDLLRQSINHLFSTKIFTKKLREYEINLNPYEFAGALPIIEIPSFIFSFLPKYLTQLYHYKKNKPQPEISHLSIFYDDNKNFLQINSLKLLIPLLKKYHDELNTINFDDYESISISFFDFSTDTLNVAELTTLFENAKFYNLATNTVSIFEISNITYSRKNRTQPITLNFFADPPNFFPENFDTEGVYIQFYTDQLPEDSTTLKHRLKCKLKHTIEDFLSYHLWQYLICTLITTGLTVALNELCPFDSPKKYLPLINQQWLDYSNTNINLPINKIPLLAKITCTTNNFLQFLIDQGIANIHEILPIINNTRSDLLNILGQSFGYGFKHYLLFTTISHLVWKLIFENLSCLPDNWKLFTKKLPVFIEKTPSLQCYYYFNVFGVNLLPPTDFSFVIVYALSAMAFLHVRTKYI